jgi:hypothetical protein
VQLPPRLRAAFVWLVRSYMPRVNRFMKWRWRADTGNILSNVTNEDPKEYLRSSDGTFLIMIRNGSRVQIELNERKVNCWKSAQHE